MTDIDELGKTLAPYLIKFSGQGRRELAIKIGRELRRNQSQRIAKQKNPDDSNYTPRSRPKNKKNNPPLRFIYQKPNGTKREAILKSYNPTKGRITGYDQKAGDIRTFFRGRIIKYLPAGNSTSSPQKRKNRPLKLFEKLRTNKYLKSTITSDVVAISFLGRVARIAGVHQRGEIDRPSKNQLPVRYPKRELLGFSQEDIRLIERLTKDFLQK